MGGNSGGGGKPGRGGGGGSPAQDNQQPGEVFRVANAFNGPIEKNPNWDKAISNYADKMGSSPDLVEPRISRAGGKERIYSQGTKYSYYITKNANDVRGEYSGKIGKWNYQLNSKEVSRSKKNIGRLIASFKKYGID